MTLGIVTEDDSTAVYANEELLFTGDSPTELCIALSDKFGFDIDIYAVDQKWFASQGFQFPKQFSEVRTKD